MSVLSEIVDPGALDTMLGDGFIRERSHPDDPGLRILNYTEKAQYERVWTRETKACRGLILRGDQVLARPWSKFFNYGEHPDGTLDLTAPVEVTDKLDGSLGILYVGPDGWAIATRGSFTSEQALHATSILRARYNPGVTWTPDPTLTYLFEIVYPENRIVVDYGAADNILLLGAVNTDTGIGIGPTHLPEWPGETTEVFTACTLADALSLPPRPGVEGVVVRYVDTPLMVKLKQEEYVRLHRLVTGLNERVVWEHLAAHDGRYSDLLAVIPDEFHQWVRDRAEPLITAHSARARTAHDTHTSILAALPDTFERRQYAAIAAADPDRALLFNLLDGRDPSPAIWKSLKPFGSNPMLHTSEDVA